MRRQILACILSSCALAQLPLLPVLAQQDGQIQHYQRKYISFFYPQDYPLNQALAKAFQNDFPRFDYHLASTSLQMDFGSFLRQTQAYTQQVAGDIAAGKEIADQRFGDKVVSWSETQQIAKSAYVFAPSWSMSEIEIDGPYPTKSSKPLEADWKVDAETDVGLEMEIWNLAGSPNRLNTLENSWTVSKDAVYTIPISEVLSATSRYNNGKEEDDQIDLESMGSDDRKNLLKELRKSYQINRALSSIENQDPYTYMMPSAVSSVGYGSVINEVQRMSEFLIRAEISDPNMQQDKVTIELGEGETAKSLGIGLDSGYKILEYVQGSKDPREVGYVKIRELNQSKLVSQPIIVGRDFELGDQVVEYPKAGVGINLRGGVIWQNSPNALTPGSSFSTLGGGGGLDLDFNIGPAFGWSEFYFLLSGGFNSGLGLLEIGLQKKWFMRQLVFQIGLRGGGSFAENNSGGGVAGTVGLQWQATPDFAFGVDTGWRQYSNLSGPLLEGFIRFDL